MTKSKKSKSQAQTKKSHPSAAHTNASKSSLKSLPTTTTALTTTNNTTSHPEDDAEDEEDNIAPEELSEAVNLLTYLSEQPELLSKKRYKEIKRAGWEFGRVLAELGSGGGGAGK